MQKYSCQAARLMRQIKMAVQDSLAQHVVHVSFLLLRVILKHSQQFGYRHKDNEWSERMTSGGGEGAKIRQKIRENTKMEGRRRRRQEVRKEKWWVHRQTEWKANRANDGIHLETKICHKNIFSCSVRWHDTHTHHIEHNGIVYALCTLFWHPNSMYICGPCRFWSRKNSNDSKCVCVSHVH